MSDTEPVEITADAIPALRSLAVSRGVEMAAVIAAARQDDLRSIVLLPEVRPARKPQGRLVLLRTLALATEVTPPRPQIDGRVALDLLNAMPPAPGRDLPQNGEGGT